MYTHPQLDALNWHPGKDHGRSDNYVLGTYDRVYSKVLGRFGIRYRMACGHVSNPGETVCPEKCRSAPNYRTPYTYHPEWKPLLKYHDRHGYAYGARKVA